MKYTVNVTFMVSVVDDAKLRAVAAHLVSADEVEDAVAREASSTTEQAISVVLGRAPHLNEALDRLAEDTGLTVDGRFCSPADMRLRD